MFMAFIIILIVIFLSKCNSCSKDRREYNNNNFLNFIYNISLNSTSANLTKKAICTWLVYK